MVQVRGKYITLVGRLMSLYKEALSEADAALHKAIGKHFEEVEPEGWYDKNLIVDFMNSHAKASPSGEKALLTLGRNIYPTIKRTVGLPPEIQTPLDAILFEAEGYLRDHKGDGVIPRKFIQKQDRHVIVQAPSGYPPYFMEGVFLGILDMFGEIKGMVTLAKGDPEFEYDIKW